MEEYGKIFRYIINQKEKFELYTYNPEKESYFGVIQKARNDGKRQVVINSEIMNNLLFELINGKGIIRKIQLADSTDQDIIDNVANIIAKMKENPLLFLKLKEELEWAYDSGSIDIVSITIVFNNKLYKINSNGLMEGKDLNSPFIGLIEPVLEEYFNE